MFPGWPCLEETPADASEPKYVMGMALVNGTTADVAQGLAKSIVEAGAGSLDLLFIGELASEHVL